MSSVPKFELCNFTHRVMTYCKFPVECNGKVVFAPRVQTFAYHHLGAQLTSLACLLSEDLLSEHLR